MARQNRRVCPLSDTATSTGALRDGQRWRKSTFMDDALPDGPFSGDIRDIHIVDAPPTNMR